MTFIINFVNKNAKFLYLFGITEKIFSILLNLLCNLLYSLLFPICNLLLLLFPDWKSGITYKSPDRIIQVSGNNWCTKYRIIRTDMIYVWMSGRVREDGRNGIGRGYYARSSVLTADSFNHVKRAIAPTRMDCQSIRKITASWNEYKNRKM